MRTPRSECPDGLSNLNRTSAWDLDQIADYISPYNPAATQKLIQEAFRRVEPFNDLGKSVHELKEFIYQEPVVSPCRIFYSRDHDILYIVHVMRVEQRLRITVQLYTVR